jgi:hypothetical protein
VADLLENEQKFAQQYYNAESGKVRPSFDVPSWLRSIGIVQI